ncbi:Sporulation stage II, protein D firmicutes [Alkaliphilus metalliredigens QYMF]|uniref:Sporulation stage II, protein D firmicutes n=1 Tax=Alkaliphilus metalliredigens (strain QYMF) TaxID=293826 RepID=A6TK71_ALKMQ|nr:stage II sporulation protein D [Alkaliphilus metalliredigens]ABR46589.1 Sporulation stage II, protein D firmicutes [Alkaliphilus metalliredigens QYMF]
MRRIFFTVIAFAVATLLIPMLIIRSCDLSTPEEDKSRDPAVVESDLKVNVYNHDTGEIMELSLEDYVTNVVAAEVPAAFEVEAIKAQAVAARTFTIWRRYLYGEEGHPNYPGAILSTSHRDSQEWLSEEQLLERHGSRWMNDYWPKIQEAVEETQGVIMTYNMQPIEPLYHSTSGGMTENSEDVFASAVPYLRSVSSPYEERSPVLIDEKIVSIKEFIDTIKDRYPRIELNQSNLDRQIDILERSSGGRITRIKVGSEELTGREIREFFELRSADFEMNFSQNNVTFITKGYGHGVGMSQWGANGMAEQGYSFEKILEHYYQGVTLSRLVTYRE